MIQGQGKKDLHFQNICQLVLDHNTTCWLQQTISIVAQAAAAVVMMMSVVSAHQNHKLNMVLKNFEN